MEDRHTKLRIEAAIGLFVLFILALLTIRLGYFAHSSFFAFDKAAAAFAFSLRTPALTSFALFITYLGNPEIILSLEILLTVILFITYKRRNIALLFLALVLGQVACSVFKTLAFRARPDTNNLLGVYGNNSFPSGHALIGIFFYGILAHLISVNVKSRALKVAAWVVAIALGLSIGLSRVYLGVHWFSDIIGGWLLGAVLLIVFVIFFERVERFVNQNPADHPRHKITLLFICVLLLLEGAFIYYFYHTRSIEILPGVASTYIKTTARLL